MSDKKALVPSKEQSTALDLGGATKDFVTAYIGKQLFGIPVLTVQFFLGPLLFSLIPLAPPSFSAFLNLPLRFFFSIYFSFPSLPYLLF